MINKSILATPKLQGHLLKVYRAAYPGMTPPPHPVTAGAKLKIELDIKDKNLIQLNLANAKQYLGMNRNQHRTFLSEGGGNIQDWYVYIGLVPQITIVEIFENYPGYNTEVWRII